MKYLRRVLPYLRPYKGQAVFLVALMLFGVVTGLLAPWPMKILIDSVLGREPLPHWLVRLGATSGAGGKMLLLFGVVAAGLALRLLENTVAVISSYCHTRLEQSIVLDFRSDMFTHAQKLPFAYFDRAKSGMLIYQVNFQGDAAAGLLMAVPPLLQSSLMLIGMLIVSLRLDWALALVAMAVAPFLYWSIGYYATHIQTRLREVKGLEGLSLSVVHEALSMFRVVTAFCRQPFEYQRFRKIGQEAVDARVQVTVRQTLFSFAVNMTTATGTALVLAIGAWHVLQGKLTIGDMLVVIAYIAAVYKPLEAISYTIGALQDKFVNLRFAWEVLDTDPEIKDAPDAIALERAKGRITFENVDFSYSGRDATLRDICFEASPGQVIAVVGPTGAGKTTLLSLLPRFYVPGRGRILLDGIDISTLTLQSLREQISLVPQEPMLFSGTIASNIRYGKLDASDEEVIAAARAANAHDFIDRLPRKYETELGERGAQLSGGERQRICVARAFLKDAPVLILDEPTSAIDSRTEAVILDALDRLMVGRTTFMIAHRLSTIHHSDWVLVLDQGKIVEQGTHQQLIAHDGLYKHLNDLQTGHRPRRSRDAGPVNETPVDEDDDGETSTDAAA